MEGPRRGISERIISATEQAASMEETAVPEETKLRKNLEDDCHKANNLITGNGLKKWLCHPKDRNGKIDIVIQLEEATRFSFIDIGTVWCASLEICVGNSDWPQTTEYKTLVPTVTLMSPIDCQLGRKTTNTQMFTSKDFSSSVVDQKWDRIHIICRQPFRKDMQLGISFIRIRKSDQVPSSLKSSARDCDSGLNKSPQNQRKNLIDIKKHFFGDSKENKAHGEEDLKHRLLQISGSAENGGNNMHEESLSRTAQLVLKASEQTHKANAHYLVMPNQHKRGLFSDTNTSKTGLTLDEEMAAFLPTLNLSMVDFDTVTVADLRHKFERKKRRKLSPPERRKFSEQCQAFMWKLTEDGEYQESSPSRNGDLSSPSPGSTSKGMRSVNDDSKQTSVNTTFHSPSSVKSSSKPIVKNQSSVKMSPAAMIRKENQALERKNECTRDSKVSRRCGKVNKTTSKVKDSSSESISSDESDICYNSSNNNSDSDGVNIDDYSPSRKTQIKRKLQTLEDVNRSYQDLYRVFTPEKLECDSFSKRKKFKSKELVEECDSGSNGGEIDKSDADASKPKVWLSASKNANFVSKSAKKKPRVKKNCVKTNNMKNDTPQSATKRAATSSAKEPELSRKIFQWPSTGQKKTGSHQDDLLGRLLQTDKYFSTAAGTGSSSMLCKKCGFLIPQDTYAAHCSTCTSPAETMNNKTTENSSSRSTSHKSGNARGMSNNVGLESDVIDLTQSDFPQCPICLLQFPQEVLMAHASECGL